MQTVRTIVDYAFEACAGADIISVATGREITELDGRHSWAGVMSAVNRAREDVVRVALTISPYDLRHMQETAIYRGGVAYLELRGINAVLTRPLLSLLALHDVTVATYPIEVPIISATERAAYQIGTASLINSSVVAEITGDRLALHPNTSQRTLSFDYVPMPMLFTEDDRTRDIADYDVPVQIQSEVGPIAAAYLLSNEGAANDAVEAARRLMAQNIGPVLRRRRAGVPKMVKDTRNGPLGW